MFKKKVTCLIVIFLFALLVLPNTVLAVGRVFLLQGDVSSSMTKDFSTKANLIKGSRISKGMYVRTGDNSKVGLIIGACGSKITLGSNTLFHVENYLLRLKERKRRSSSLFSLIKGKLRFITGKLFGKDHEMTFKSEVTVCAVRGTSGYLQCTPSGRVLIVNATGDGSENKIPTVYTMALTGGEKVIPPYEDIIAKGQALPAGKMVLCKLGQMGKPTDTPIDIVSQILKLCQRRTEIKQLLNLCVSTAAKTIGAKFGVKGKRKLKIYIRKLERELRDTLSPVHREHLLKRGPKIGLPLLKSKAKSANKELQKLMGNDRDLQRLLQLAKAEVKIERVIPIQGNNPLAIENPLHSNQQMASGGQSILFGTQTSPEVTILASLNLDPPTYTASLRNNISGNALIFRSPGVGLPLPAGVIEAYTPATWISPTTWFETSLPPKQKPWLFLPNTQQTISLQHLATMATATITFVIEVTPGILPTRLRAKDFRLRIISISIS